MSSSGKWEQALPRFSLDRRITVLVIMVSALVVGAVATVGIPLELIPQGFESPELEINAPWRDAPPREVLDKVVLPLEEELSTVRGLDQLNSFSSTGRGRIFLAFKQGTDMDVAYREVRDRLLRAKSRLPDDLEPVRIMKKTASSLPITMVGVAIDQSVTDPYNLIQREIITPLARVPGVASVSSQGLQEKEVLIEIDREKTAAAGLNIYTVGLELGSDNFSLASGTVRQGARKLLLRSVARYDNLDELRQQLVSPNVRLGDIAEIRYAEPEKLWRVRVNSKPALALQIFKEGQANTIEVGEALAEAFEKIQANPKLATSDTAIMFSQGDVIKESLSTLLDSGKIGAVLAALVLLFFLRRFRLTLIITLSIPLSLVIALTAMYFVGETLNILSLLGLIISVGLLVDNSVVVAENIIRLRNTGMSRRDACIEGAAEIALAIILATLTTIIVFLPVALVEGKGQFFLLRLALPITVSLAASLFVALVFVPLCVYLTMEQVTTNGNGGGRAVSLVHRTMDRTVGEAYRQTLDRANRGYNRLLAFFLRHRLDLVITLLLVFGVTLGGPAKSLKVVQVSEEDRQGFEIGVELPGNYSLDEAEEFFASVEKVLDDAKPNIGVEGYFIFHMATFGNVSVWFPSRVNTNRAQAIKYVMDRLPKRAGVKYFSGSEDRGKQEDNKAVHSVVITGENPETLEEVAEQLEQAFLRVDGVLGVKNAITLTPNEVALVVDRARAARQQVNPQFIAGVVAMGLRGQSLPRFQQDGKEIPVRLRFNRSDSETLNELADFAVPNALGQDVQLSSVTDVRYLNSSRGIFREGKLISRRITLDLETGKEEATSKRIDALAASINLPEGVRLGTNTGMRTFNDDVEAMQFAALVSILFIYLLMGFLFESFILPLSIILTIPAASIGVIWAHAIAGRDLDFLGFVGVVLLIGVVVNNGIVFVDYVNRLRIEGHERTEAVLLAARRRFRPIAMTAATTICGMIPLTLGEPSSLGLSYRSFGLTLIGGMVTATVLTLLVVPVFYTLLDDARDSVMHTIRSARRGRSSGSDSGEGSRLVLSHTTGFGASLALRLGKLRTKK